MNKFFKSSEVWAAGLAIFSMFFGAGNIIFPLVLGQQTLDQTPYGLMGLLLTAVAMPFMGLLTMLFYKGQVKPFFNRIGAIPGLCLAILIISLLGPLGSTPRCIALAYSTFKMSFPHISITWFSGIACIIIFMFAYKKTRLLSLLGYVLTPFLVLCLIIIIAKGFWNAPTSIKQSVDLSSSQAFFHGLKEGYNTMDLLAAFFFAPLIINAVQKKMKDTSLDLFSYEFFLQASLIGAILLGAIYIGFAYIASYYSNYLETVPSDQLLATISIHVLGSYAAVIVGLTVVLACLTTAIALIAAFTEFVHKEILDQKVDDRIIMIVALLLTFIMATFEFQGISQFLSPILQTCYPALIVLTVYNAMSNYYTKFVCKANLEEKEGG